MIRRNWQNFWSVLVVSLFLFQTLWVCAQEIECDTDDPEKCAAQVKEGDPAPFSGQLVTDELAISMGTKLEGFNDKLELELKKQEDLHLIDTKVQKKVHQLDNDACDEKTDLLMGRLKEAQQGNWYEHPAFVATISVVLTSLLFFGAVYAIDATTPD